MYTRSSFLHPDPAGGPLQIVHDFQFVALNLKPDLYTFPTDMSREDRKKHVAFRISRLHDRGYAGIVISVDNRHYLEDEDALELIAFAADQAAERGMRVWLYDEQYYPSGSAGGLTLRDHPELEGMALACVEEDVHVSGAPVRIFSPLGHSGLKYAFARGADGKQIDIGRLQDPAGNLCWDAPDGDWHIWCFFLRPLYEGTPRAAGLRASRRTPSVSDARAMARFLDVTWSRYEKALGARLGSTVEAVFTDEPHHLPYASFPEGFDSDAFRALHPSFSIYDRPHTDMPVFPFVPWPEGIDALFEKRNGYPLAPHLPELFSENFANTRKIRRHFFDTLSSMFDNAFMRQYAERLARYPMRLSGHWWGEENLLIQPYMYGDLLHFLGEEDIPGCDLLYSAPEKVRHAVAVKFASSAAHQYGRKHCMIEASNMCDRDQTFSVERIELAVAMMYSLGIDTVTSYYGEELFDEDGYRRFAAYTARLGELVKNGTHQTQALLYYPYEEMASLCPVRKMNDSEEAKALQQSFLTLSDLLLSRQVDYDIVNQEILLRCEFRDGRILTPGGETPSMLVFPAVSFVDPPVARVIADALRAGVPVFMDGTRREIEGLQGMDGIRFLQETGLPESDDFVIADEPLLNVYHVSCGEQDIWLLVNTGENAIVKQASLPGGGERLLLLNPDTGSAETVSGKPDHGRTAVRLSLPPLSARALVREHTKEEG